MFRMHELGRIGSLHLYFQQSFKTLTDISNGLNETKILFGKTSYLCMDEWNSRLHNSWRSWFQLRKQLRKPILRNRGKLVKRTCKVYFQLDIRNWTLITKAKKWPRFCKFSSAYWGSTRPKTIPLKFTILKFYKKLVPCRQIINQDNEFLSS